MQKKYSKICISLVIIILLVAGGYVASVLFEGERYDPIQPTAISTGSITLQLPDNIQWLDEAVGEQLTDKRWQSIGLSPYETMQPYKRYSARSPNVGSVTWLQDGLSKLKTDKEMIDYLKPIDSIDKAVAAVYFSRYGLFKLIEGSVPSGAVTGSGGEYFVQMIKRFTCGKPQYQVYSVNRSGVITELTRNTTPPGLSEASICSL